MTDTSVGLLCEASGESELSTIYSNYFENTHVKSWKVLGLFTAVLERYKPITYDCVDIFVKTFKKFGSLYSSTDKKLQSTMNSMVKRCQSVIRSDIARALVAKERVEQSRTLYCAHITEAVLKDKTSAVTNSSSLSNTGTSAIMKRTIYLNSA
ncbi:hypothetical protein INT47_010281 [Mucor saturninus]|uniref:Uncharacterized protein n=1 Tax=Mucor saturninus TaxID=64648 RepID=A0A8H7UUB2_9FUNG|nr:hypothetical protein INT47_010281 [Mucor saturninus]